MATAITYDNVAASSRRRLTWREAVAMGVVIVLSLFMVFVGSQHAAHADDTLHGPAGVMSTVLAGSPEETPSAPASEDPAPAESSGRRSDTWMPLLALPVVMTAIAVVTARRRREP